MCHLIDVIWNVRGKGHILFGIVFDDGEGCTYRTTDMINELGSGRQISASQCIWSFPLDYIEKTKLTKQIFLKGNQIVTFTLFPFQQNEGSDSEQHHSEGHRHFITLWHTQTRTSTKALFGSCPYTNSIMVSLFLVVLPKLPTCELGMHNE